MIGPPGAICTTWGFIEAFTAVATDPSFVQLSPYVVPGLCNPPIQGCVLASWQGPCP